jgi:hypothetical protein
MAIFGALWTAAGSGGIEGPAGVVALITGWTIAAVLIVGSVRLRKGVASPSNDDPPRTRERQGHVLRRFNLVFGLELLAIAVSVFGLVLLDLGTLIPPVVALIVGIHFFPLASLFGMRAYYLTGGVLCALALITLVTLSDAPNVRLALAGMGSAITLFATAAYLLIIGGREARAR